MCQITNQQINGSTKLVVVIKIETRPEYEEKSDAAAAAAV